MEINIRKAKKSDYNGILKLKREFYLWEAKRDNLVKKSWAFFGLGKEIQFDLSSKNKQYFIAEMDGKIVGYALGVIQSTPDFFKFKKWIHLHNLYVKKEFRKKGIGKKLIELVIDWANTKKIKSFHLYVYDWNDIPKSLYKKIGFRDYAMMMVRS